MYAVIFEAVQGAIDLDAGVLRVDLVLVNRDHFVIRQRKHADNVVVTAVVEQDLDTLTQQSGVVGVDAGELNVVILIVAVRLVGVRDQQVDGGAVQIGDNADIGAQIHPLVADRDRLAGEGQAFLGVVNEVLNNCRPADRGHIQAVSEDLRRILTSAARGHRGSNFISQAIGGSIGQGVGRPVDAGQTSVLLVVASQRQSHLHGLGGGYLGVRIEAGCRLTSNDAGVLQVLDVALRPVAGDVGKGRRVANMGRRVVVTAVADGVDHLRHLSTVYRAFRIEGTILIALDDTKGREQIHGFDVISVDIRLIRERCRTGEHGERAGERQHQCENLFLMAEDGIKSWVYTSNPQVNLHFSSQF